MTDPQDAADTTDPTHPTDPAGERLAKRLARQLGCSRSQAEQYIENGFVSVDGVVIDTPNDGAPTIHAVKDTSPIVDRVRVGDKLVAVDDEDVRAMTAMRVSKLISKKGNNPTRKLTIIRHER